MLYPFNKQTSWFAWSTYSHWFDALFGQERKWFVLVASLPLLLYGLTLAPTVYGLDSAELTTGAYVLGIVHAPGSPTYLLIGHLFSWIPFGDIGYRLNLMSAIAITLSNVFLFAIVFELTKNRWLAFGTAWFTAFSYYVWIGALIAELYALQGLFLMSLIWVALQWHKNGRWYWVPLLTFGVGIGLGNHLSLALAVPGFTILLAKRWRKFYQHPWLILLGIGAGLFGTLIFLYLPIRYLNDPPLNYAKQWGVDIASLQGFWWMISGQMFGNLFWAVPTELLPHELSLFLHRLWSNFAGIGCLLGGVGLIVGIRQRPFVHLGLLFIFLAHLGFYITYLVGDKELMFLPTYLIWGIWLGEGITFTAQQLNKYTNEALPNSGRILLLFMTIGIIFINYPLVDLSDDWSARELGENIITAVDENAIFIGSWKDIPILEYLQIVENKRTDLQLVNLFFTGHQASQQIIWQAIQAETPIYTSLEELIPSSDSLIITYIEPCDCYQIAIAKEGAGQK